MQSLIYGLHFIGASFSMAKANPRLQKPSLYLIAGHLVLLIFWLLPLALVVGWMGLKPVGLALIGLMSVFCLFSLLIWGEIMVLKTCQAFASLSQETEQPAINDSASGGITAHWVDGFLFAMAMPGWQLIYRFSQLFKRGDQSQLEWLDAHYLVLPAISFEDITLSEAVDRVKQIVAGHLLRFRANFVGVRSIAVCVQWILMIGGMVLGFMIGSFFADPITAGLWRRILGPALGSCVAGLFIMAGSLFSSFTRACYYTTTYQWVCNMESARQTGDKGKASPPPILRQVLGKPSSGKKER